jgi:hypothetical protein
LQPSESQQFFTQSLRFSFIFRRLGIVYTMLGLEFAVREDGVSMILRAKEGAAADDVGEDDDDRMRGIVA